MVDKLQILEKVHELSLEHPPSKDLTLADKAGKEGETKHSRNRMKW